MAKIINIRESVAEYNDRGIMAHVCCEAELAELLTASGSLQKSRAALKARLDYLAINREQAVQHRQWFEKLKHSESMYALRIVNVQNLRILYAFSGQRIYLLCAFAETERGKRASYQRYIPVAEQRLKEILEVEGHV